MPAGVASVYRLPVELWESILQPLNKPDLYTAARISRVTHWPANVHLYHNLELSLGRCSDVYIDRLSRTILKNPKLAALVKEVVLDGTIGPDVWLDEKRTAPQNVSRPTIQTLVSNRIQSGFQEALLPLLVNLESFKFIRGVSAAQDSTHIPAIMMLGALYGRHLKTLCLHDASLAQNKAALAMFTGLHRLDLGFSEISHRELAMIIDANASTLKVLKLNWVIAMPSLFHKVGPTATFPQLTALHLTGKIKISVQEMFRFLSQCPNLRRLEIDEQEDIGANGWADVFDMLVKDSLLTRVEHLFFGGPRTTQTKWWVAVANFLRHLDTGCLKSLWMHARQIGTSGPVSEIPDELRAVLLQGDDKFHNVKDLIIIWRAVRGIAYDTVRGLSATFPNLERLHLYVLHPAPDQLDFLVNSVAEFRQLRNLHLICPKTAQNVAVYPRPSSIPAALTGVHIAGEHYPYALYFLVGILSSCHAISTVSWIRHEPWSEEYEDCLFMQILKDGDRVVRCRNLTKEHFTRKLSPRPHCYVLSSNSRFYVDEKPSWAGLMTNSFVPGNVCARAVVGHPA